MLERLKIRRASAVLFPKDGRYEAKIQAGSREGANTRAIRSVIAPLHPAEVGHIIEEFLACRLGISRSTVFRIWQ